METIQTKELAEQLGIKDVTVRKYANALFDAGRDFARDSKKYRVFTLEDVELFRSMMSIQENERLSVMESAKQAVMRLSLPIQTVSAPMDKDEREQYERELTQLHKRIDDLSAIMMVVQRESAEIRRMIAEQHKRKWWKWWQKDLVLPDLSDPETVWKLKNSH